MTRPLDHASAPALNASPDLRPARDCSQVSGRGGSGRAYGAAHGHRTARYWSRHATWKVTCALSGKVTMTASPYTGWAHQAQGRTGCPCRRPPRVAFALGPPFRRSTGVTPPTRPGLGMPPAHTGGRTPLPWASQRYAGHRADAHDPRKGGLSPSRGSGVSHTARVGRPIRALSHRWLWEATSDHRLSDDPPRARLHVPVVGDGRQRPSPSIEPPLSRRHDRARKARLAVRWRARACRRSAPLPLQTTPRCRRRATGT
jgi:hypothetical protein